MRQFLLSKSGLVLLGFLAIAGYFLWTEHQAHVAGYLPLLLILGLCAGLHFFLHGGRGPGRGSHEERYREDGK